MDTRTTLIALAVVAALGLAACGKEESKSADAAKTAPTEAAKTAAAPPPSITIMIGHVAPLTGGIAHLGKDNENGAQITIDGKEAKFVLVAEDDQADPKVGTTVAQKLVDAKVAGVVGHLNSGTTI